MKLVIALTVNASILACAPPARYEQPPALRGYEILITRRDSLGQGIAEGLRRRGFTVRRRSPSAIPWPRESRRVMRISYPRSAEGCS